MERDKEDQVRGGWHSRQIDEELSGSAWLVVFDQSSSFLFLGDRCCWGELVLLHTVNYDAELVVIVQVWHTNIPVWALLLSLLLPTVYTLPSGFIYAMTGQGVRFFCSLLCWILNEITNIQITVNLLAQIIPGTLLPGNPYANMVFKAYSVQTLTEAVSFIQDLKLGHYIKVPPRSTFLGTCPGFWCVRRRTEWYPLAQLIATMLAAFVQVGVKEWIFSHVPDICHNDQKSSLTCPHNQVFYTASAVWCVALLLFFAWSLEHHSLLHVDRGLIGPSRQFGTGALYHPQLYAIIGGALLPIPFWLYQRRYPNSWVKFISTPVVLNGVSYIPPATGINYSSWFAVGFVFQYLIRRRNFAWWSKFNYITSAALDSGEYSVLSGKRKSDGF